MSTSHPKRTLIKTCRKRNAVTLSVRSDPQFVDIIPSGVPLSFQSPSQDLARQSRLGSVTSLLFIPRKYLYYVPPEILPLLIISGSFQALLIHFGDV